MQAAQARLTVRTVEAIPAPAEGESVVWDRDLKGFHVRVHPSGRRVYALKYRFGAQQRKLTLGVHGSPLTPEKARQAAQDALDAVRRGDDPAAAKKAAREALTVADLIDRYLADGPATKPAKRASTWVDDASNLNRHIRPLLGRRIANQVAKADAARAIRDVEAGKTSKDEKTGFRGRARVTGGPGAARRTRLTAAAMFAWGTEHGLIANNPFKGVKLAAAPVRERFLSKADAAAFLDAIQGLQGEGGLSGTFADAMRLLLLTGARKTEVLGLRWSEVDFERQRLTLPPERTKAGGSTGERRIVLSPPALAILAARRAAVDSARETAAKAREAFADPEFVFPAARGEGHAVGLRRAFTKATERAGLSAIRIHDLRHSFASFAVADGASLFLIGKLLGHASARTTERYAHLAGDPLQDAAAMVGRRIMGGAGAAAKAGEGADDPEPQSANVLSIRGVR
jgi:integrase